MTHTVLFDVDALRDLAAQFDYLAPRAGERTARNYLAELHRYCLGFGTFPERGTLREDLRPGLRLIGYRRRATIAFTVKDDRVLILRVFFAGQDIAMESEQEAVFDPRV